MSLASPVVQTEDDAVLLTLETQIRAMVQMQEQVNRKISPDWRAAGFAWYRGIWVECAEMLEHAGWKWWKHQSSNMKQMHLEIVDVLVFGLSERLVAEADPVEGILRAYLRSCNLEVPGDFRHTIEHIGAVALTEKRLNFAQFFLLCRSTGLGLDALYRLYVAKNTLNDFRQDFGYKTPHYIKVWDDMEDNVHLERIIATLDSSAADFPVAVYQAMVNCYPGSKPGTDLI